MSVVWRNRAIALLLAAAVFGIDQWLKGYVTGPLGLTVEGDHHDIMSIFDFTLTFNYGVSFGLFTATSSEQRWALVAVTGLIAVVVATWLTRERKLADVFPLGLILGGALGNIVDRVTLGYVVDFADLHFGTVRPFMIFNIADAAISVGVVIMLVRALFMREKPAAAQGGPEADETAEIS